MFSKKIKTVVGKGLVFLAFASLVISCGDSAIKEEKAPLTSEEKELESIKRVSTENVFYSIPSPIETASLLKKAGAVYDKNILNPIENKDKYSTLNSRALNLGVYGSDLSYTTIFDKSQESMLYLACAKKLADGLGITSAFDASKVERMEANMGERDSLLSIISDSYWETDAYLQENDRGGISGLIIAGGWIEGLYIATKIEENLRSTGNNKEIIERISDQKLSLENIIKLLESIEKDQEIKDLTQELQELKIIFDTVEFTEKEAESTKNAKTNVTTIGNTITTNITQEQVIKIAAKVAKIRNNIIQ